jgi:hypothetical protein
VWAKAKADADGLSEKTAADAVKATNKLQEIEAKEKALASRIAAQVAAQESTDKQKTALAAQIAAHETRVKEFQSKVAALSA